MENTISVAGSKWAISCLWLSYHPVTGSWGNTPWVPKINPVHVLHTLLGGPTFRWLGQKDPKGVQRQKTLDLLGTCARWAPSQNLVKIRKFPSKSLIFPQKRCSTGQNGAKTPVGHPKTPSFRWLGEGWTFFPVTGRGVVCRPRGGV